MNRNHLWKLLLILFVVGFAISEIWPPRSRPLFDVFQANVGKRDATYSNIVARFEVLQKENPQNEYGNLRDAIGTNDISRHFEIDTRPIERLQCSPVNHEVVPSEDVNLRFTSGQFRCGRLRCLLCLRQAVEHPAARGPERGELGRAWLTTDDHRSYGGQVRR